MALLGGCPDRPEPPLDQRATNIVLIVVDCLRADHLETYAYTRDTSPRIEEFSEQATVFHRAYSHAPWTKPSIASLLTSLTPREHGVVGWPHLLPDDVLTLAEHLDAHGYHTQGHVSHFVLSAERSSLHHGFDVYDASVLALGHPHEAVSSEAIADAGVDFLRAPPSEPFFLLLHFFDPHASYLPHEGRDFGAAEVDLYDGEIAYTDHHVGRVLDELGQRGHLDDTVVVITADHGEEFGDHGGTRHSTTLYDELVRVPLIVHVPGLEPGHDTALVRGIDVAPTLLALVGVPIPEDFVGEPIGYGPAAFDPSEDRVHFMETRHMAAKRGVLVGDWKLVYDEIDRHVELFDLEADPLEQHNLARRHPLRRYQLVRRLEREWGKGTTAAVERPLDDPTTEGLRALGYLDP